MYNNTCGIERPTEPPTTEPVVPTTTVEDVVGGGRYFAFSPEYTFFTSPHCH